MVGARLHTPTARFLPAFALSVGLAAFFGCSGTSDSSESTGVGGQHADGTDVDVAAVDPSAAEGAEEAEDNSPIYRFSDIAIEGGREQLSELRWPPTPNVDAEGSLTFADGIGVIAALPFDSTDGPGWLALSILSEGAERQASFDAWYPRARHHEFTLWHFKHDSDEPVELDIFNRREIERRGLELPPDGFARATGLRIAGRRVVEACTPAAVVEEVDAEGEALGVIGAQCVSYMLNENGAFVDITDGREGANAWGEHAQLDPAARRTHIVESSDGNTLTSLSLIQIETPLSTHTFQLPLVISEGAGFDVEPIDWSRQTIARELQRWQPFPRDDEAMDDDMAPDRRERAERLAEVIARVRLLRRQAAGIRSDSSDYFDLERELLRRVAEDSVFVFGELRAWRWLARTLADIDADNGGILPTPSVADIFPTTSTVTAMVEMPEIPRRGLPSPRPPAHTGQSVVFTAIGSDGGVSCGDSVCPPDPLVSPDGSLRLIDTYSVRDGVSIFVTRTDTAACEVESPADIEDTCRERPWARLTRGFGHTRPEYTQVELSTHPRLAHYVAGLEEGRRAAAIRLIGWVDDSRILIAHEEALYVADLAGRHGRPNVRRVVDIPARYVEARTDSDDTRIFYFDGEGPVFEISSETTIGHDELPAALRRIAGYTADGTRFFFTDFPTSAGLWRVAPNGATARVVPATETRNWLNRERDIGRSNLRWIVPNDDGSVVAIGGGWRQPEVWTLQ